MAWKHVTSLPPRKFSLVVSARKVMATVFWDAERIVLIDYLKHGSTITGTYYANPIGKCRVALKEKRRGKLRRDVLFHQDNAPAHTSSQARTSIRNVGFELLHHSPYSPDLAPSDFYLFPKLKESRIKNSSTMESRLWRNAGPSAFLLEGTMLKNDKIACAYSVVNCVKLRTF